MPSEEARKLLGELDMNETPVRLLELFERYLIAAKDSGLEEAATISDQHWPESGHIHQEGAISCQMSISVEIRRRKSTYGK